MFYSLVKKVVCMLRNICMSLNLLVIFNLDALQQGASQFEQQAGKLKRKYWWKNLKVSFFHSYYCKTES